VTAMASPANPPVARVETPLKRFVADYCESKLAVAAFFGFVAVVFIAIFAPWLTPQNPHDLMQIDILDNLQPPGSKSIRGWTFVLGTDGQGRDMLSAIFYGLRISIFVGVVSGFVAFLIGTLIGLVSAYAGGRVDSVIMRIVDLQLSFPTILIALVLLAGLGQGVDKVVFALIMVQWAYYARTVRAQALVERRREYIESAECLALDKLRIVLRHLLPNCLPPLIVIATVQVAHSIALEASLSFLGVGLPPTEPSLGLLISNGREYIFGGRYWISVYPGIALLLVIVTINLMGDHLRDVLNPRLRR